MKRTVKNLVILVLFSAIIQGIYLHRVPGLMGDEGSEGENVYELLTAERTVVTGERSYIGPAIDYLRVPLVGIFGYNALALRVVVWVFSMLTVLLAWSVLTRAFGMSAGLIGTVMLVFSPAYLTYQRLGWTITLLPFFIFLTWWLIQSRYKHKWLLAGLAAGLGVANHIIFAAAAAGLVTGWLIWGVADVIGIWRNGKRFSILIKEKGREVISFWPALAGFWAGFGMQFVVLILKTDDQGDPSAATAAIGDRLADLRNLWPLIFSGSAFTARYTGVEYPLWLITIITWLLSGLGLVAVGMLIKKRGMWALVSGMLAQGVLLLDMIDRFSLRYFVVPVLGGWLLAGLGVGGLIGYLVWDGEKREKVTTVMAVLISLMLIGWFGLTVLTPFLKTGGSTNDFSLANRWDSAAALVDTRALLECLSGVQNVYTENVHIWNRLQYISHGREDIAVLADEVAEEAEYLVDYRWPEESGKKNDCGEDREKELCPEMRHFCVVAVY